MATMLRANKKATRIAYNIIGKPANMIKVRKTRKIKVNQTPLLSY